MLESKKNLLKQSPVPVPGRKDEMLQKCTEVKKWTQELNADLTVSDFKSRSDETGVELEKGINLTASLLSVTFSFGCPKMWSRLKKTNKKKNIYACSHSVFFQCK